MRVKVCCMESIEEARIAVACGADAVGLVSEMPSGPGIISEEEIARIAATVPPPVATFLLTSQTDPARIVRQQRRCGANTLQICDSLSADGYRSLRKELPGVSLVGVIHVAGEESIEEARSLAELADALLLDTGSKSGPNRELGGTGRTHDWSVSRQIVDAVTVPVFLAGGLRPENVAEAIKTVRPFAVDLCSGVRTEGRLDSTKLTTFMAEVGRST